MGIYERIEAWNNELVRYELAALYLIGLSSMFFVGYSVLTSGFNPDQGELVPFLIWNALTVLMVVPYIGLRYREGAWPRKIHAWVNRARD